MWRPTVSVDVPGRELPAWVSRAVTGALSFVAVAFIVLAVLYFVRPAADMPGLIPGLSPVPSTPHRYRLAVASLFFATLFASIAVLRWRTHTASRRSRRH